ncbi:berberine bridge enzyme-like 8 [Gossypium hirsutum]|uniref:Berberine bridge enzyme-like 8 n=1 Tax=Gossypium hirsutum TaxID=3635 RepID=A0A1U8LL65_GOSHI|nr:berberine bridge enzyme-like 8 [Gossypium hirsutum]
MKSLYRSLPLLFVVCSLSWVNVLANSHDDFLDCLSSYHPDESFSISKVLNAKYPKPSVIVTPLNISHVQATIHCSKKHGLQIRTRSGGHDYEGLSYVSHVPFVVIDLVRFKSVEVDVENEEVWVQSGAIVGEVYYRINERSTNLTFPGAFGYTVGIGGFISGGGDGLLSRKYGLAADNVIDVQFVDASGRVLDRRSIGEDLTLEQNASQLLHRWQYVAPNLPNDVYSLLTISKWNAGENETKTVLVTFTSLFQCGANELIPLMQERFPELGLVKEDFIEMTWIESVLFINRLSNETSEVLLDRYRPLLPPPFKSKSDFVNEPVLEIALQGLWPQLLEVDEAISVVQTFIAYGAMMDEISETVLDTYNL